MNQSYYEVLGIPKESKDEDVKKAYKKLVSEHHPDKNPGNDHAEAFFKKINEAYATLSNPQKKLEYDRKLFPPGDFQKAIFDEIFKPFNHMHGNAFKRKHAYFDSPGEDVYIESRISFTESYLGTKRSFPSMSIEDCIECNGMGARAGTKFINCGSCGGSGCIQEIFHVSTRKCPSCSGRGSRPLLSCVACSGVGKLLKEKPIIVSIPSGVKNGDTLRVSGKGQPGNPPGELYIIILVQSISNYLRHENDIHTAMKIPLNIMVHGGKMEICTPWGSNHILIINPCTDSGDIYCVDNAGFKSHHGVGNLLITLNPIIPKVLTTRAKMLFNELMDEINPKQ